MAEMLANPNDTVTRYIFDRKSYTGQEVKHNAFMPPERYPNELSVCVISELSEADIWKYGKETRKDKELKARADLAVSAIHAMPDGDGGNLRVLIDGIPHKYHANIKDLPLEKALRLSVAASLANIAKLVLFDGDT